jgi:hypothetical protein
MGRMKDLYTALQELGDHLEEFDPTSFEDATRLVELFMGPIERPKDAE